MPSKPVPMIAGRRRRPARKPRPATTTTTLTEDCASNFNTFGISDIKKRLAYIKSVIKKFSMKAMTSHEEAELKFMIASLNEETKIALLNAAIGERIQYLENEEEKEEEEEETVDSDDDIPVLAGGDQESTVEEIIRV